MSTKMNNFPLLHEIDEQINFDDIDWNKNAYQTLLTSNLPQTTIFYYAIDVGLRLLENSLYESYWDVTADILTDLSQYVFTIASNNEHDSYLYEAKCQLLFYASIAVIKFNTIRRHSIPEAKMSCATMSLLLFEQTKSYETPSGNSQYSSCTRSMRSRYLKRIFLIGQWLPTLSKAQFNDIQSNHERYIETMIDRLFSAVSLRDKINGFIENSLLNNNNGNDIQDNDATTDSFVVIQRFPKFNEKTIEKNSDLMHMGLTNTLKQQNKNSSRKLISCVWILSCMIESDRITLGGLNRCLTREHFSQNPIDFEQKPILIETLNDLDVIVFLLLCAQQNVRLYDGESTLHPYLLYASTHLCTQRQKHWWQTAMEQTRWPDFLDHLATIRLDNERLHQYPPKIIIFQTAKILFKAAEIAYEQHSNRLASSYEQYAIQYFQTAKAHIKNSTLNDSLKSQTNKLEKLFFFYPQKIISENNEGYKKLLEQLIDECEKLTKQCDELKLLPEPEPEPPRTSSPTNNEQALHISSILSPVHTNKKEQEEKPSLNVDSTLFETPSSIKTRDIDVQTITPAASPSPLPPVVISSEPIEEIIETPPTPLPPIVDAIFSHMNGVNHWINRFCITNEGIQNDINTIRDRLEKLNRATSQMIFSNVRMFQSNSNENTEQLHPPN